MTFVDELSRELAAVGVRGARRRRILAEIADHLSCDPEAVLGAPNELARQFADELGTERARRAAFATFLALSAAGVLFAVAFFTAPSLRSAHESSSALGLLAVGMSLIAPQFAVVAGVLAALRALRHRRDRVVSRSESIVIVRRAELGLGAGIASMVGLALVAAVFQRVLPSWWFNFALISAIVAGAGLLAAAPAVISARRLVPTTAGTSGDIFDDLGLLVPAPLRGRPWTLALIVAGAVAVAITAAGVVQSDGPDGALRGLADAVACLAGFAVLGRYLGLRR